MTAEGRHLDAMDRLTAWTMCVAAAGIVVGLTFAFGGVRAGVLCAGGLAGAGVAARGHVWDPARGRRRCPRCWYDMSRVGPLVCPECGRSVRSAEELERTRPARWVRLAGIALAACSLAAGLATPDRLWGLTPRAGLVVLLRVAPESWEVWRKIGDRSRERGFAPAAWELRWIAGSAINDARERQRVRDEVSPRWNAGLFAMLPFEERMEIYGWFWSQQIHDTEVEVWMEMMDHAIGADHDEAARLLPEWAHSENPARRFVGTSWVRFEERRGRG